MTHSLDQNEQRAVLNLARSAIQEFVMNERLIESPKDPFFQIPAAAFVTIKIDEELRGCIGSVEARLPLGEEIIHSAWGAAFRDPRFPPLSRAEFPFIKIDVSILSPFREIQTVEEIVPGIHGIMVTRGFSRGLLLPQVAVEQQWDRYQFLSYTCQKAGLSPEAWKHPDVKIEIFSAQIFGEE